MVKYTHEVLIERARQAIADLFTDDRVSRETTCNDLKSLKQYIEDLADTLGYDI